MIDDPRATAVSKRRWRIRGGIVALVLISGLFSFFNAGERVTLELGLFTLYRISLVGLVFVAFLLGMSTMFLFGLRHDRRVRRMLRRQDTDRTLPDPYLYESPPRTGM